MAKQNELSLTCVPSHRYIEENSKVNELGGQGATKQILLHKEDMGMP